EAKEEDQVNRG
ncbi:hypothetical protein A2U01_0107790, partial [Trifolium medium]|nr:hypothetical protein [Trifolium medium]